MPRTIEEKRMHKEMHAHAHHLRKGRFSETGRIYLVTTVTHDRQPVFSEFYLARRAISALHECDRSGLCKTLSYVLMPDHLHWLFQLEQGNLSVLVARYKHRSAELVNRMRDSRGVSVWQKGFHDHALRMEEDLVDAARYIVANPLRAGLAAEIGEYPHWDAVWLE